MQTFEPDELQRRVDEVLFYFWDPIGVSPSPEARGEYRSYVSRVFDMLSANAQADAIAKYLRELESVGMALAPNDERIKATVELLFAHKRAIDEGLA